MTIEQDVQEKLALIETLKEQIKDLYKEKAEVVEEINKPVYKAKAEAEKIIADANAKAEEIYKRAEELKIEVADYVILKQQEADEILRLAKVAREEARVAQETLDKRIVDFNASKYAYETNLRQRQMEADKIMGQAVKLQDDLKALKLKLDNRESAANRRDQDSAASTDNLNKLKESTEKQIEEFKTHETAIINVKAEIMAIKAQNEDILRKIQAKGEQIKEDIKANEKVLEEDRSTKTSVDMTKAETDKELNRIAEERAKLTEQMKTVHERERLQKLLARQIDEKIRVLNKLRAEEKIKVEEKKKE